jgi:hypothetical protein
MSNGWAANSWVPIRKEKNRGCVHGMRSGVREYKNGTLTQPIGTGRNTVGTVDGVGERFGSDKDLDTARVKNRQGALLGHIGDARSKCNVGVRRTLAACGIAKGVCPNAHERHAPVQEARLSEVGMCHNRNKLWRAWQRTETLVYGANGQT